MVDRFDMAFALVIGAEGGYVNDPNDPGGETKYGISKRAYPNLNIPALTIEQAKEIYRRDYWIPLDCDILPAPMDLYVFDAGVNMGKNQAKEMKLESSNPDEYQLVRIGHYIEKCRRNPNLKRYFFGWVNRVIELTAKAKEA